MKHYNFIITIEAKNQEEAENQLEELANQVTSNFERLSEYCEVEEELV